MPFQDLAIFFFSSIQSFINMVVVGVSVPILPETGAFGTNVQIYHSSIPYFKSTDTDVPMLLLLTIRRTG
jgi:hypothetical protein